MTIKILLTQGQVTVIDEIDGDLAELKWQAQLRATSNSVHDFVAVHSAYRNGKYIKELLHRTILSRMIGRELLRNEYTDHINCDPLDNRRSNLRLATPSQNGMNIKKRSNNTSGFKGVTYHKATKKWEAQIAKDRKLYHLGLFTTPEEAFEAFCKAGREYHGEFFNPGSSDT